MQKDVYQLSVTRHLANGGDRPALTTGDRALSYSELDATTARLARKLLDNGTAEARCVALVYGSQWELALALLTLARLQVPFLAIPRSTPHAQALEWAARAGVDAVLSDCPEHFADLPRRRNEADGARDAATGFDVADPRRLFAVIGGSGSTGRSKLIPVSQAQMCNRILDTSESLGLTHADRSVGLIHLEFASAQHRLLAALCAGGCVSLVEPWSRGWLRQLRDCEATVISAGVVHVEALLRDAEGETAIALPSVRALTIAGSTVSDDLRRRVSTRLTPQLWVVYGSNECWYATVATPAMVASTPGTIGVHSARSRVRIVTSSGMNASAGEVGRIVVGSASLPESYLDGSREENRVLRDGWFDTGDLGRQLPDGQIAFCGRHDNLMIFNGVNIYPVEIEQCALGYPGVAQAVAFPMRHAVHQHVPLCAVSFRADAPQDGAGLFRHLASRLGFRAPVGIYLFDALPLISHGKPSVREIARLIGAHGMTPITRPESIAPTESPRDPAGRDAADDGALGLSA